LCHFGLFCDYTIFCFVVVSVPFGASVRLAGSAKQAMGFSVVPQHTKPVCHASWKPLPDYLVEVVFAVDTKPIQVRLFAS
jgi:hypothetical protein